MRIDGINGGIPFAGVEALQARRPAEGSGFGQTIKSALSEVNELQYDADEFATKLAVGDPVEIHQAMLAMNKASMALQFTIQVRNKIIETYQEIMRMQI